MTAHSKWRDTYKVHPAADAFPMMSEEKLAQLGEDIKANGLNVPLTFCWIQVGTPTAHRVLIDGRNRLEATRRCPKTAKATVPGAILSPKIDAADDDQERRIKTALSLWKASAPLPDTLGSRYFTERRGLHIGVLGDLSHALRWHEGIGAVVALMTNAVTNEPTGIHRTFLNPDGTKRERKMLGKQGVIRLSPDDEVTAGLGLTEGVEDGLAVLLSGWAPVWCATSSGAIERFPTLGGVEALTVFADDDPPGMKSAHACVSRWNDAGCEARISDLKDLRS